MPTFFDASSSPFGIQLMSLGSTTGTLGGLSASTVNNAVINNTVLVSADTGDNTGAGTSSLIRTGNAYAAANIVNISNTNILGRNWMNAVVNIFGDWNGNISFGQPDLWVGTRAEFDHNNNWPGSEITYTYTVTNHGDAPAHTISLRAFG
jgi:hypothetical protein